MFFFCAWQSAYLSGWRNELLSAVRSVPPSPQPRPSASFARATADGGTEVGVTLFLAQAGASKIRVILSCPPFDCGEGVLCSRHAEKRVPDFV